MRNNKGVTLTSLVIMIIVITILTSVTIYTGFELYETSRANAFKAEMQTIQERVNLKCQNLSSNGISIDDFIQDFTLASGATTNSGKRVEETDAIENLEQSGTYVDLDQYVYFNKDSIRDKLDLEGIDAEVLINFYTRDIINLKGVKYNDKIYYRLIDINGEYKNIEYTGEQLSPNDTSVEIAKRCYGINTTFEILNDEVSEVYIGERLYDINGDLTLNVKSWKVVPKEKRVFRTNVNKTGVYDFKILFKDGTEKIFHDQKVELCNAPELSTGMIPVMWIEDNTSEKGGYWKRIDQSNSDEMGQWYDYSEKKWANIMLKDGMVENEMGQIEQEGSMFVWIPRFMYQITKYNNDENTGYQKNQSGVINIKFMLGNSNLPADKSNSKTSRTPGSDKWIVHPCFKDGNITNYQNGEWREEINGIWVAKYPAGMQAGTITYDGNTLSTEISNADDEIVRINRSLLPKRWYDTAFNKESSNYYLQKLDYVETETEGYPVFKPLTYRYIERNNYSYDNDYNTYLEYDACYLGSIIAKANEFYGLDYTKIDSHLMKNSEWGAVAYLTFSKFGRDRIEPNINNFYTEIDGMPFTITGIYADGSYNDASNSITSLNAYSSSIGVKGSSTGNITGIYDLNGGSWEKVAASLEVGWIDNTDLDEYGYEYLTRYPYDGSNSNLSSNNYNTYRAIGYGYGDAILEVSSAGGGQNAWMADFSNYPWERIIISNPCKGINYKSSSILKLSSIKFNNSSYSVKKVYDENVSYPIFARGGSYDSGTGSGIFAVSGSNTYRESGESFRVVLINSEPLPPPPK